MDKEAAKPAGQRKRGGRALPEGEAIRCEALRQLKERLEGGELSTGDLLKIMGMSLPEEKAPAAVSDDWVLVLGEEA